MNTTIWYLEAWIQKQKWHKKVKNFFREIKVLIIMFIVSFVGMLLFTNAELFFGWDNSTWAMNWKSNTVQENWDIDIVTENSWQKKLEIEKMINSYEDSEIVEKVTALTPEQELKNNLSEYKFDFNVLPPTNRIVITKINLDVPLIDSKYKNESDFTQWNFNEELENGVVKYPTTPQPWAAWNTLIFGHTSQERWQKNPYGTVFSKIPNLVEWDMITIIWGWKMYEYKVIEKIVVTPSNVNKQYQKYQDKWQDYITLMGCYPLWRTDKRMMITAIRVK